MSELRGQIYNKVYHGLTMAEADHYTDWILSLVNQSQQQLLTELLEQQFWAADDAYDAGDVVSVSVIQARLDQLKKLTKGE